jgi:hypothetical protein
MHCAALSPTQNCPNQPALPPSHQPSEPLERIACRTRRQHAQHIHRRVRVLLCKCTRVLDTLRGVGHRAGLCACWLIDSGVFWRAEPVLGRASTAGHGQEPNATLAQGDTGYISDINDKRKMIEIKIGRASYNPIYRTPEERRHRLHAWALFPCIQHKIQAQYALLRVCQFYFFRAGRNKIHCRKSNAGSCSEVE